MVGRRKRWLRRTSLCICLMLFSALPLGTAFCQVQGEEERVENGAASLALSRAPGVSAQTDKEDDSRREPGRPAASMDNRFASYFDGWGASSLSKVGWPKLGLSLFFVVLVLAFERVLRFLIKSKIRKKATEEADSSWKRLLLEALYKPLSLAIWVYGLYLALSPLFIHFRNSEAGLFAHGSARRIADIVGTVALIWFIYRLVDVVDVRLRAWAASTESTVDDILAPLIGRILRISIVIISGMMIVQNLTDIKIGTLLASLGIGGLALALAAKESISNFFGTLTILFDKPFQLGERIVIDSYDGVVESVGFRSTRVRTLTGHLVSIPNEKAINSNVENIGRRPHIRWMTNITITYDTPPRKVERAVLHIQEILENHEGMNEAFPPRVYFNGFNDWSLNIAVFAWYHPPDYWAYQAWLQKTCLEIMRRFESEGIEFAFPSRTVYLAADERRQLKLQMLQGEPRIKTEG